MEGHFVLCILLYSLHGEMTSITALGAPTDLTLSEDDRGIRITWNPPPGDSTICLYNVLVYDGIRWEEIARKIGLTWYRWTDYAVDTQYRVKVICRDQKGSSSTSRELSIKTQDLTYRSERIPSSIIGTLGGVAGLLIMAIVLFVYYTGDHSNSLPGVENMGNLEDHFPTPSSPPYGGVHVGSFHYGEVTPSGDWTQQPSMFTPKNINYGEIAGSQIQLVEKVPPQHEDTTPTPVNSHDIVLSPINPKDIAHSPVNHEDIAHTPVNHKDIAHTPVNHTDIAHIPGTQQEMKDEDKVKEIIAEDVGSRPEQVFHNPEKEEKDSVFGDAIQDQQTENDVNATKRRTNSYYTYDAPILSDAETTPV